MQKFNFLNTMVFFEKYKVLKIILYVVFAVILLNPITLKFMFSIKLWGAISLVFLAFFTGSLGGATAKKYNKFEIIVVFFIIGIFLCIPMLNVFAKSLIGLNLAIKGPNSLVYFLIICTGLVICAINFLIIHTGIRSQEQRMLALKSDKLNKEED